jgi:hypothetical protein
MPNFLLLLVYKTVVQVSDYFLLQYTEPVAIFKVYHWVKLLKGRDCHDVNI